MRFNNPTKRDDRPRHLIRHVLRLGYCATLLGKQYSGKSDMATAIALAVAEGNPFAGNPTTQGGVLWLSAMDPYEHQSFLRPLRDRLERLPFFVTYDRPAIDTEEGIRDISDWIAKARARLVVVDGLTAFHRGGYGWNAWETLAPFKRLCYQAGATGLVLSEMKTHAKPEVEAARFADATDLAIYLHSAQTRSGRRITLKATGRGDDSRWHRTLLSREPFHYEHVHVAADPGFTRRLTLDDQVLALIAKAPYGASATQISAQLDRNPNSVRNAIARLRAVGKVRFSHTAGRCRRFQIHKEGAKR